MIHIVNQYKLIIIKSMGFILKRIDTCKVDNKWLYDSIVFYNCQTFHTEIKYILGYYLHGPFS